jgi:hypothetical protein
MTKITKSAVKMQNTSEMHTWNAMGVKLWRAKLAKGDGYTGLNCVSMPQQT